MEADSVPKCYRWESMKSLRLSLLGAGGISRAHAKAFPLFPDRMSLVGICDVHEAAAADLANEMGGDIAVFNDHRRMLQDVRPDAVIITLPHDLHYQFALDCMTAGVHVLVEKPVTCNAHELRHLDRAATERHIVLMAGQMRRFDSSVRHIKAWCGREDQPFGELRSFDVVVQVNIDAYTGKSPNHWILDGKKAGGGVVASFGIHRLDLIRHLGNSDFAEVTALGRFDPPFRNNAESQASVLFRMTNGAIGTLHANALAPRNPFMDSFCLHGTQGSIIEVAGPMRYATTLGAITSQWSDQYTGFIEAPRTDDPHEDPFVQQLLAFVDAIVSGKPPIMNSARENFNTIACLDALATSLRTGSTTTVETW